MPSSVFVNTWKAFQDDKCQRLASAIAYAAIFSLAPLLIVFIGIGGNILGYTNGGHGHHLVEQSFLTFVRHSAGADTAQVIENMVDATFHKPHQGFWAQIIAWITFVVAASGLFGTLQDALNSVWQIEAVTGSWVQQIRERIAAVSALLLLTVVSVASLALSAVLVVVSSRFSAILPFMSAPWLLKTMDFLLSFLMMSLAFAVTFKVLPDVDLRWKDVGVGAVLTAALFVVGEYGISLYLAYMSMGSVYGAVGTMLAALLWMYYSSLIFLFGAEFTKCVAGEVHTTAPARVRSVREQEAGSDPRQNFSQVIVRT